MTTLELPTFSFAEFVRVLLKNKKTIIASTLIVMIVTAGVSFILPKTYKASVTLLISESKMGVDGVLSSYFNPRFYYTFEGFVKNKDLARRALKKFGLDKPPYVLKVETFLENIRVQLVRNTRLIDLSVAFSDPRIAADLANYIAQESVALNQKENRKDSTEATTFMKRQVEAIAASMAQNEKILKEYKEKAKIKELETDVETLLYTKADLTLRRLDARVKKGELLATGKITSASGETQSKSASSTSLKDLDALISSLDKMIADVEKKLDVKQRLLAERETRIEALTTKFDADQKSYRRIKTRYDENATRVSEKFQEIRIIDPAIVPYYAEWPRKKLLTLIAGALAFLISCGYVLLREQLRSTQAKQ